MRISYLKEFIILSKCLNYSLAAKHLNITQPGLSRHIAALEDEIGVKLFSRDTHKVTLTRSGVQFLDGIKKIIRDYENLCESVLKGDIAKLTIGIPYYGINRYLSHIVSEFEVANRQIQIEYFPAYPDEIIMGLLSMQADVAVFPRVDTLDFPHLTFQDAFKEPFVVMMNKKHVLSSKARLTLTDIAAREFIVLKGDFGMALFKNLCDVCSQQGLHAPQKIDEADSIEAAALKMKPDTGMMVLPHHLTDSNISGNVKCVDLFETDCYLNVSLVRSTDNPNPAIDQFIRFYMKQV